MPSISMPDAAYKTESDSCRQRRHQADSGKDLAVGERFKAEADKLFRSGRLEQATTAYSKAIIYYPWQNSAPLWHNRALCLYRLSLFRNSIADLDQAIDLDPNYGKAHSRRDMAKSQMESGDCCENVVRSLTPVIHPDIEQTYSDSAGRYYRVRSGCGVVKVGSAMLVEPAVAAVLLPSSQGQRCEYCLSKLTIPVPNSSVDVVVVHPCRACTACYYCSDSCRQIAYQFHRNECGRKLFSKLASTSILAYRFLIEQSFISDGTTLQASQRPCPLRDQDDKSDAERLSVATSMSKSDLLQAMRQIRINGFFFKSSSSTFSDSGENADRYAIGIFHKASLFNHNCSPTASVSFMGRQIRVFCTAPMTTGDTVSISYGPITPEQPSAIRRQHYQRLYEFQCLCDDCANNLGPCPVRCRQCDQSWDFSAHCPRCPSCGHFDRNLSDTMESAVRQLDSRDDPDQLRSCIAKLLPYSESYTNLLLGRLSDTLAFLYSQESNYSSCVESLQFSVNTVRKRFRISTQLGYELMKYGSALWANEQHAEAKRVFWKGIQVLSWCLGSDHDAVQYELAGLNRQYFDFVDAPTLLQFLIQ